MEGLLYCTYCLVRVAINFGHHVLGEEERAEFLSDLEQFIARLLHMIEVDVAMDLTKQGKIIDQVHGEGWVWSVWVGGCGYGEVDVTMDPPARSLTSAL